MPQFVPVLVPKITGLDQFTRDYLECIEWLLDEGIDRSKIEGFSPDAIIKAEEDCKAFKEANRADLDTYYDETGYEGGVDLWLTRNHHGAGFWDRGLGDLGKRLTDAARLGEQDAYLGDDNLIYLT